MRGRLDGKIAIITGAGSGIGRASAILFASEGARLVIGDKADSVHATARAIEAAGGEVVAVQMDAGSESDVAAMVDAAVATYGGLDIAFANAGISGGIEGVFETTPGHMAEVLRVNLIGPMLMVKHAGKRMWDQAIANPGRGGAIILTASVAGIRSGAGGPSYSALEGGRHQSCADLGTAAFGYGRARQRDLPRPHRNGNDATDIRLCTRQGRRGKDRAAQSAASCGATDRARAGGAVSGFGRSKLCQRSGDCRRWRAVEFASRDTATDRKNRSMKYRQLGDSGIEVSEICLGSWLTYGVGVEADKARACLDRAFDEGITFIDTANAYGRGAAETFLGEALKGRPRDSYVMATKLFFPMTDTDKGLSRAQVEKQIDASLTRLQTDYVDLYQCHRYDNDTPLVETMQALSDIVKAGKARAIGFSEWSPKNIEDALAITGATKFVSSQPQYSLLWRRPEAKVIPLCAANGISQIVWSPLAQGVLTGKYKPGQAAPDDSRAANATMNGFIGNFMRDDVLTAVQQFIPLAEAAGCTLAQFALAWVLREPNVTSAIVGASRPQQVTDNARASGLTIDPALFAKAEAIVASLTPPRDMA